MLPNLLCSLSNVTMVFQTFQNCCFEQPTTNYLDLDKIYKHSWIIVFYVAIKMKQQRKICNIRSDLSELFVFYRLSVFWNIICLSILFQKACKSNNFFVILMSIWAWLSRYFLTLQFCRQYVCFGQFQGLLVKWWRVVDNFHFLDSHSSARLLQLSKYFPSNVTRRNHYFSSGL